MTGKKRNIAKEIHEGLEEVLDFVEGRPTQGRVTYMFGDRRQDKPPAKRDIGDA